MANFFWIILNQPGDQPAVQVKHPIPVHQAHGADLVNFSQYEGLANALRLDLDGGKTQGCDCRTPHQEGK